MAKDILERESEILSTLKVIGEADPEAKDDPVYRQAVKDKVSIIHVILKSMVEDEDGYRRFKKLVRRRPVDRFPEELAINGIQYLVGFMKTNGFRVKKSIPIYKQFERFVDKVYMV